MFECWYPGICCEYTAGITSADHLTVKKRLIAAGKQMNMCQPSGKVTQNTMHPLYWDKGVILLYGRMFSHFHCSWTRNLVFSHKHNCNQCNKFGLQCSPRSASDHISHLTWLTTCPIPHKLVPSNLARDCTLISLQSKQPPAASTCLSRSGWNI